MPYEKCTVNSGRMGLWLFTGERFLIAYHDRIIGSQVAGSPILGWTDIPRLEDPSNSRYFNTIGINASEVQPSNLGRNVHKQTKIISPLKIETKSTRHGGDW